MWQNTLYKGASIKRICVYMKRSREKSWNGQSNLTVRRTLITTVIEETNIGYKAL